MILNFIWNSKGPVIIKTLLEKNGLGKLVLPDNKTYFRPHEIKYKLATHVFRLSLITLHCVFSTSQSAALGMTLLFQPSQSPPSLLNLGTTSPHFAFALSVSLAFNSQIPPFYQLLAWSCLNTTSKILCSLYKFLPSSYTFFSSKLSCPLLFLPFILAFCHIQQ